MAYGDTITYEWGEGEDKHSLRLTYNAYTYLVYKRFYDTDLMNDILKLVSNSDMPDDMRKQIENGELSIDDIDKLDIKSLPQVSIDYTILLQMVIAMIATNDSKSGKRRGVEEIAIDLPMSMLTDVGFFNKLIDLIMFGLKKN